MIVSLVVAMDQNRVIGNANSIPWKIPADMSFFKAVTMHHPVIMGRKTHESIGRPLPGRLNIIITRQPGYLPTGNGKDCIVVSSLEAALEEAAKIEHQEIFIIGGAEIFTQAMPVADKLYVTEIEGEFQGDTYFPEIRPDEWNLVETKELANETTGGYTIHFKTYTRKE